MKNRIYPSIFCCFLLLFSACRKDLLHWQYVQQISVAGNPQLNNAIFLPSGLGVITGGARFSKAEVLTSTDQGKTWQNKQLPNDSKGLFGACYSPNGTFYSCGMYMSIFASNNGLNSYEYKTLSGREEFIAAVSFGDDETGVAVSTLGTDSGAVIRFDKNLQLISFQRYTIALWDVKMLNGRLGFAVGSGLVMKTQDGGINWLRLTATGDNFNSISVLDSNQMYVSGLSGYILRSSDGGNTWQRLRNGSNLTLPDYQLWDLLFLDTQKGYAVGEKGLVIYTDDGGKHWAEFDKFTNNNLRFISLCPDGKLLVGGEQGALYRLQPK